MVAASPYNVALAPNGHALADTYLNLHLDLLPLLIFQPHNYVHTNRNCVLNSTGQPKVPACYMCSVQRTAYRVQLPARAGTRVSSNLLLLKRMMIVKPSIINIRLAIFPLLSFCSRSEARRLILIAGILHDSPTLCRNCRQVVQFTYFVLRRELV